jgi:hypothetical protein
MLFYIDFTALLISNRKTKLNLKHNISPSPFVCPLVNCNIQSDSEYIMILYIKQTKHVISM